MHGLVVVPIVQVAGALAMTADGATVAYAAVAPNKRGEGIGWRLEETALAHARGQGAETVTLGFVNEL